MLASSRLIKNAVDAKKICYQAFERHDLELQTQEATQLRENQLSVSKNLLDMINDRYAGIVAVDGLNRVNPYNLKGVVGVRITPQQETLGLQELRVTIAKDQSFIDVEASTTEGNESYMYVHEQEKAYLKVDDARLPLTHPLAINGLERFKKVCEVLGVTSLATT